MKRIRLICPNNPEHPLFRTTIPATAACSCIVDEHGDIIEMEEVLEMTYDEPSVADEYLCVECEERAIATITGVDPVKDSFRKLDTKLKEQKKDHAQKGTPCLAAEPYKGKLSPISIGIGSAIALIVLHARWNKTHCPIRNIYFSPTRNGIRPLICHGLITPGSKGKPPKKGTGFWSPNQKGTDFLYGKIKLREHLFVVPWTERVVRVDGGEKSYRDLFKGKFANKYEPGMAALAAGDTSMINWIKSISPDIVIPGGWNNKVNWTRK